MTNNTNNPLKDQISSGNPVPQTSPVAPNAVPMQNNIPMKNPVSMQNTVPITNTAPMNNTVPGHNPVPMHNPVPVKPPKVEVPLSTNSLPPLPINTGSKTVQIEKNTIKSPDPIQEKSHNTFPQISQLDTNTLQIEPITRNSSTGSKILWVFLVVLVIGIFLGLGSGVSYLKGNYVPYLSPVLEDVYNTPSDQLSNRLDKYIDLAVTSMIQADGDTLKINTDYTQEELPTMQVLSDSLTKNYENISTKMYLNAKIFNHSIPINIDNSWVSNMLPMIDSLSFFKSKEFTLGTSINSTSIDQFSQSKLIVSAINDSAKEMRIDMDTIINANDLYIKLNDDPILEKSGLRPIGGKWVLLQDYPSMFTGQDASLNGLSIGIDGYFYKAQWGSVNIQKSRIESIKNDIRTRLSSKEILVTSDLDKKCYNLDLTIDDLAFFYDSVTSNLDSSAKKFRSIYPSIPTDQNVILTLCFRSDLVINKVELETKGTGKDLDYELFFGLSLKPTEVGTVISTPTDNVVTIEGLIPTLFGDSINTSYAETRNAQRTSDVAQIRNAIMHYTSVFGNSSSDLGQIPACSSGSIEIGTGTGNIDLGKKFIPDYINLIPEDPSDGTESNTGYAICVVDDGRFMISALNAENGRTITVK